MVALGALRTAAPVFADSAFSTNFMTLNTIVDQFGGMGTSTSFLSVLAGGGDTLTGEASSTNFQISSGPLYYDSFTPQSQQWRWYDDISD